VLILAGVVADIGANSVLIGTPLEAPHRDLRHPGTNDVFGYHAVAFTVMANQIPPA
jgi:hypothetical protein